jgi:hypothetical protein
MGESIPNPDINVGAIDMIEYQLFIKFLAE